MTLKERLEEKLEGLEIALECEEAVVERLLPHREVFNSRPKEEVKGNTRRVFQLLDSEKIVRNYKQEIADLQLIIDGIKETNKDR